MNERTSFFLNALEKLQGPLGVAIAAGIAGGLFRWITLRENMKEGIATLLAGLLASVFLGPAAAIYLGLDLVEDTFFFAALVFVVGTGGISIGAIIISIFKDPQLFTALRDAAIFLLTRGRKGPPAGGES